MIKGLFFAKRKAGISPRDFQQYWRTTHADVTRPLTHVYWCIQSHTLLSAYGDPDAPARAESDPPYEGMSTMWFESVEARKRGNQSPQTQAAINDQANFTELSARRFLLTNEIIQKDDPACDGGVHLITLVTRKPGMSVAEFQRYWREHHGPLAAAVPGLRRYVQNHPMPELYGGHNAPLCDGVAEGWFESIEDLRRSNGTSQVKAIRADGPNFLDAVVSIVTQDFEVIPRRF
jgi:uncharacterized protein (TIGR02118 family)